MQAAREQYVDAPIGLSRKIRSQTKREERQFEFKSFMTVLIFLGLAALAHVFQQALVAQNGIDMSRLKLEIKEERRLGKGLAIQKILLESPSRIERLAAKDMGMVKPAKVTYIIIPAVSDTRAKVTGAKQKPVGLRAVLARASLWTR